MPHARRPRCDAVTRPLEVPTRIPPHNLDAERAVLGAVLLEGRDALPRVGEVLRPSDFYTEAHRAIYQAMLTLFDRGAPVDSLTLSEELRRTDQLQFVGGRPSMGKAQPRDARVKTPTGWARMSDLGVGDRLASIDGRESVVRGVYPQRARQVYRVVFSDGRATECCAEHLWRVHHRGCPEPRTLTTAQIAALLACRHYRSSLWIDTPSGDDGHAEPLPVDPWLLGALLGAGQLSGGALRFWTSDPEVLARVAERADGRTAGVIIDALRRLRLWDIDGSAHFVPDIYMDARRPARVDLLRGLLGAAGVVEPRGMLQLTLTSGRLARAVATLARSLGAWCAVRRRSTRAPFVCIIDHPEPKELLTVSSKLVRTLAPRRPRRPMFVSIEPTRVTETQCIAVTHPSALYITDDHVVTHNTAFALNIVQHVGVNLRGTALVLSLEMSAQQLVQRMLCSEAKVDSQAVRTGFLSSSDWHRLTAAAGRLSEAKIFIDDSPSLTVLEARAKARRMKAEHGLDLLLKGYLQRIRRRAAMDNRQQEISEISRSLKALAKELNIPVVALSQLSRAVEARAQRDFRPQLSDLRECVTGDTLVRLSDGRRVPIRDLVDTAPEVLAMSPRGTIVSAKSERIWRVGRRALRHIRLMSGRSI